MIALPKEPSRVSRLVATMARVDEYVCTFRGDVSSFVRYDKERKKWDVELTWLRARDGEDRSLDLRYVYSSASTMLSFAVLQHFTFPLFASRFLAEKNKLFGMRAEFSGCSIQ